MVEVVATDEFKEWFEALDDKDAASVEFSVGLLELQGVALGFPHSSKLGGTKANLRELRAQSGGRPLRIAYAFDPLRQAVLLLGGDKTGNDRFYERFIADAERILKEYLDELSTLR